jgi:glycosyltransferase involved in cell wall biosynthesis
MRRRIMGETIEIIGIVLVRDEDIYIRQVLKNILAFCDRIIVADNLSNDRTAGEVASLMRRTNKIEYHRIRRTGKSHDLIAGNADQPRWIFAVDGDELYDPAGLRCLRKELLRGAFDDWWMILGNVLHCRELNREERYARGYLTPPCRSMTKLYNFSRINRWDGPCAERLHGGRINFKAGYSMARRLLIYEKMDWEASFFRCLHLCFLPRSSREAQNPGQATVRRNIVEKRSDRFPRNILHLFRKAIGKERVSVYKREMYMRGALVQKSIAPFFSTEAGSTIST